jgi:hypothetical protein
MSKFAIGQQVVTVGGSVGVVSEITGTLDDGSETYEYDVHTDRGNGVSLDHLRQPERSLKPFVLDENDREPDCG